MAGKKKEPVIGQTTEDTPTIMGRPTLYSDELVQRICSYMIEGMSLRKICELEDIPTRETICKWLSEKPDFSDQYARACKLRRENKFDELEDIAETETDVKRARLRVDVIKWQLSKEDPKKYGDKLDLTSDNQKIGRGMTEEDIDAVLARAELEAAERAKQANSTSQAI